MQTGVSEDSLHSVADSAQTEYCPTFHFPPDRPDPPDHPDHLEHLDHLAYLDCMDHLIEQI